jgi:membrane dipeptidase
MPSPDAVAEARALIDDMLVWDNHACMPLRPDDYGFLPELEAVHAAGVDVISINAGFGPQGPDEHLAMLDSFTGWLEERADRYRIIHAVGDVAAARAEGRLGVLFDVEGMYPLNAGRIDLVEDFRRRGVGWMLIAYNRNNDAGGGCADADGGLTDYGRAVLDEMRRVGMIVCCSHTGHRTVMDVIEHAGAPVIFSHSNAAALHEHYRNIPDDLIRACAETGGVVGINGLGAFLGDNDASPERVAQHVDHVAQLVGARHVAIGLDYVFDRQELVEYLEKMRDTFPGDELFRQPLEMLPPTRIAEVAACLIGRGYRRDDLAAILGGNWLRVAGQVWH